MCMNVREGAVKTRMCKTNPYARFCTRMHDRPHRTLACLSPRAAWVSFTTVPKRIAILGSTGSIGRNTLDVIQHLGAEFRAVALSGHRQAKELLEQVRTYRPAAVALSDRVVLLAAALDIGRPWASW